MNQDVLVHFLAQDLPAGKVIFSAKNELIMAVSFSVCWLS